MNESRLYSAPASRGVRPLSPVTRKMLHERTCEIARLAGRSAPYVTQDDYEQAKRELTGDPYALIMDTTIDVHLFVAPQAGRLSTPQLSEGASAPPRHDTDETPASRLFFGGSCPRTGAT